MKDSLASRVRASSRCRLICMVRRGHGINRLLRYACSGENRQDWQIRLTTQNRCPWKELPLDLLTCSKGLIIEPPATIRQQTPFFKS